MSHDVIELNGKRYDALTGAYLGKSHVIPQHIIDQHVHGKVIDGFVRPSRPVAKTAPKVVPKPAAAQTTAAPPHHHAESPAAQAHNRAAHLKAHNPERAKTLMRRGAHKPEFSLKPAIKMQTPAEVMARPQSALTHKRLAYGIDPARKERAALAHQHQAVRHFTTPAVHAVSAQVPAIPVQPTPLHMATPAHAAARGSSAGIGHAHNAPTTHHTDIFETAIAHATSHEQPAHKAHRRYHLKRRWLNTLAIVGTFLVIGGFIGYLNIPGIELKVASVQAGFGASLPTYAPTGYALNDIHRSGGTITLGFRSGASSYHIVQQSSNWNSQTLLDNTLALNGEHDTVQKNGQIIYVYKNGGTNAAWVNSGIRYDIVGNAELSNDEIAAIAASL